MKYSARDQKPKTAIIYTRVSTDEQADYGFSLAHQEDLLRKECARRGIHVVAHYKDEGYSAKDFKRPYFQQLLDYLKRHKKQIQYLFVTKWCRFSRNIENTILMNRELLSYGTRVITLDDGEESDNPANLLLTMLNMTLPEIDNRIRSRNTKSGIIRALKEGYYPYGYAPVGYSKDRSALKTPLLVPDDKAPLVREAFEVFATGAFPIEDVRKASWKNGLRLQRSQFGQMFRNPVYAGKLYVPETTNEEGCLVKGVHEAIVSEELFLKVQKILNKRTETNSCLRTREKLRDELPLRGHLTCPECGKTWTGSISSGNGGKYPYYHCERSCKVRVNADVANERFLQFLGTLQPPQEIVDLQMAMMEVLFKAKEGDRDQQLHKLRIEIERHKQNLLKLDQQRFLTGEMDADSYKRLKMHTAEQIDRLTIQMNDLEIADTAFEKYARYGMSLLKDLAWYFQEAEPQARRKLLGSIFPAKLIFKDGNYRTSALNPALALILQKNRGLGNEKAEDIAISENVSGDVERSGVEPLASTMPLLRSTN
jgi:site-specific DNA recombinase